MRKFTAAFFVLLLLATLGLAQQTIIITGPTTLTGPITIRVIPPLPGAPPQAPGITTASPLPDGDEAVPYSQSLAATGGLLPYSWSLVATETLPQMGESWTPLGGAFALVETFGDTGCSALDNTWPTVGGMTVVGGSLLTSTCSGYKTAADANAVIENGLALTRGWVEVEFIIPTLPTGTTTVVGSWRSATNGNLVRLWHRAATGNLEIYSQGSVSGGVVVGAVSAGQRYKAEIFAERGSGLANDAKARARIAVWNGSSYNAYGALAEDNVGTWTDLLDQFVYPTGIELRVDTHRRCQFGTPDSGACGVSAPDLYTTPIPAPNNVYVNGSVPIDEALWSHDGTDLTLEIATDPALSVIEVSGRPATLTLSAAGVLSGTPDADGAYNLTARVCDANALCATKAFVLDVNAPPVPTPPGPWVQPFTPVRTHYVSPSGSGSANGTIGNPESFATARSVSHYQCGDLHILRAGTYNVGTNGQVSFSRDCTSGAQAYFKGYVDANGQEENVIWQFEVYTPGRWNRFMNIHRDGTGETALGRSGFEFRKAGNAAINSVIHDVVDSPLSMYRTASTTPEPGQISYGNVLYAPGVGTNLIGGAHDIYTQNLFAVDGYKYVIQTILLEPQPEGRRLFQANDSNGDRGESGHWLQWNFFGDATAEREERVMWSQSGTTAAFRMTNNVVKENWFVDHYSTASECWSVSLGHNNPMQYEFTDNYLARASVRPYGYWGHLTARPDIVFTGNEIYDPPCETHIAQFQIQDFTGADGSGKIPNADVWNLNTYGGTFRANILGCNGTASGNSTLAQWRDRTDNCRVTPSGSNTNGFDLNSTVVANPTTDAVLVLKNEYQCPTCVFTDQARGNIYCANWDENSTCSANIATVVGFGKHYVVRYPRDYHGAAAAEGDCPGSGACNVSLPTKRTNAEASGKFANVYVITGEP